jgi:outer membrane protein assembly factor BamA
MTRVLWVALACLCCATPLFAQEVVADVQVHGNTLTPEHEVLQLSGITIGMTLTAETLDDVAYRLRETRRFESVTVLKRFASISDPTRIMLVIVVDEGPVKVELTGVDGTPRVVKNRSLWVMFLPVLQFEDGYGWSYGARFTLPDAVGKGGRLSFPGTWGGEKRAAIELDKTISGPSIRVLAGLSISRRTHPFYEASDDRLVTWVRGERALTRFLRAGATGSVQRLAFIDRRDRIVQGGVDIVFDTRLDPVLPRNAIFARAAWDRIDFIDAGAANRADLEARGYIGLVGQNVLVIRAMRTDADQPLPPSMQPMLGGMRTLRGFEAGTAVGNTLVAGSLELRVPLTSPLNIGRAGISMFMDAGAVYDEGERLRDQRIERGFGGGAWFSAAIVRVSLVVAHGVGGSTRVHFGTNVTF